MNEDSVHRHGNTAVVEGIAAIQWPVINELKL